MQTQTISGNTLSIRTILYGDAVVSGASGLLLALASRPVTAFLGLAPASSLIILDLGLLMIAYAALLVFAASRPSVSRGFVLFTWVGNLVWVAASVLLLLSGWVPFSAEGKWALALAAVVVDLFATLQFLEWRKM